jgi:hypothetical protein
MSETDTITSGPIAWMARNSVAANLLLVVVLVGGGLAATRVKQEVFPEFDLDIINVTVPYPGASPTEVEQAVNLAVEEAMRGIDGVKRVSSVAREGSGGGVFRGDRILMGGLLMVYLKIRAKSKGCCRRPRSMCLVILFLIGCTQKHAPHVLRV